MDIKEKSKRDFSVLTKILFAVYLAALTWAILFKFKINIFQLHSKRTLILEPFFIKDGHLNKPDFYSNIAAFIPYGVYLLTLKRNGKIFLNVIVSVLIMFMTSLFFETSQYIFKIGCSDINDLISNTLGGIIGVLVYYILYLVFRKHTNTVINILAGLCTAAAAAFVAVSVVNGSCGEFQSHLTKIFSF